MSLFAQTLRTPELKAQYLLTLPAIRDRCSQVHDLAKEGKLEYFDYHPENEEKVADFCLEIIQVTPLLIVSQSPLTQHSGILGWITPQSLPMDDGDTLMRG